MAVRRLSEDARAASRHGSPSQQPSTAVDLDVEVLKTLVQLSPDGLPAFSKSKPPPPKIVTWIRRASPAQLDGLLIAVLRQWHQQRQSESDER